MSHTQVICAPSWGGGGHKQLRINFTEDFSGDEYPYAIKSVNVHIISYI